MIFRAVSKGVLVDLERTNNELRTLSDLHNSDSIPKSVSYLKVQSHNIFPICLAIRSRNALNIIQVPPWSFRIDPDAVVALKAAASKDSS